MIAPPPISGNAYELDLPQLKSDWTSAIDAFETDPMIARIFPEALVKNYVLTKRQEQERLAELPPEQHWKTYLETV